MIHVEEQYDQRWAAQLQACLLLQAKEEIEEAKRRGRRSLSRKRIACYQHRYSRILRQGAEELPVLEPPPTPLKCGRPKQHRAKNLYDRLNQHIYETLAIIYDFSVPFDNNLGERNIRINQIMQKISECCRSVQDATSFARIRSYIYTTKKQGRNVLGSLAAVFQEQPLLPENC